MGQLGGMLLLVGILSFILPYFGLQFKLIEAIGNNGWWVCSLVGTIFLLIEFVIQYVDAKKGNPKIDVSKLNFLPSAIDQEFFIKLHIVALGYGGANNYTLNTLKSLVQKDLPG